MLQDINLALNNISLIIVLTLCWFFLSACSTTNNVTTFTPPAAKADQAIVYIYRPTEMSNSLYSPGLNIDGEFKLYIKNGVNSRLSLTPGEHLFEFQADKKYSELSPLLLTLDTGTIYFIRVNTSLKIKNTTAYEPYMRSFKLTQIGKQQAVKEIASCCIDNNKVSANKTEIKSTEKKSGNGFSVDKTQNPFSH
ncbi:MAG: hypothetical protein BMS9Abin19_0585 [Gammaproteobacteria bacterium]|nr:MAG: hypothetical protein BMS9Abin19_0585 [Gammaproteobacteria bacterium]